MSMRPSTLVHRGVAAIAATALTLTLAPAAYAADEAAEPETSVGTEQTESTEPTEQTAPTPAASAAVVPTLAVRLKVARKATRRLQTSATHPRGLLREQGVRLGGKDLVRLIRDGRRIPPAGDRRLRADDKVRLVRVDVRVSKKRVTVPRRTITRAVSHLSPGVRRVERPGRPGVRVVRVQRTLHNWTVVDRKVGRTLVRTPRPRKVLVGKRFGSVRGADHLRWGALARCESSGNPRAVNPAGYYGLYQFDVSTWRSVGGRGLPHQASAAEQTHRAKLLYRQRGRSPWPHCGRLL